MQGKGDHLRCLFRNRLTPLKFTSPLRCGCPFFYFYDDNENQGMSERFANKNDYSFTNVRMDLG